MGPRRESQRGRVLAAIVEAPGTSPEVAAETGLPIKHCCSHLRSLWQDGFLTRTLAPHLRTGRGRAPWLYTLAVQKSGPTVHIPVGSVHQSGGK